MLLIGKKHDSEFNPIVTLVGVFFLLAGAYGMALLWRDVFRHPIVLLIASIPTLFAIMGALIVLREIQLFRDR
jgi:hypothetical protein